jgi:hypothetical protein
MKPIRYIGKKARKEDNVAHTGTVWNGPGDVQNVPDGAAAKLLVHTDCWVLADGETVADPASAGDVVASTEVENDERNPPLVNLDAMDKEALRSYAQQNFGHAFHPNTGEAKMRQAIIGLMNRG